MVVWEVQSIIIIIMTNANTSFHKEATGGKAGGKTEAGLVVLLHLHFSLT